MIAGSEQHKQATLEAQTYRVGATVRDRDGDEFVKVANNTRNSTRVEFWRDFSDSELAESAPLTPTGGTTLGFAGFGYSPDNDSILNAYVGTASALDSLDDGTVLRTIRTGVIFVKTGGNWYTTGASSTYNRLAVSMARNEGLVVIAEPLR